MQDNIRHELVRGVMHAEPTRRISEELSETELTRAARGSVDNADKIIEVDRVAEFATEDETVTSRPDKQATKAHKSKVAKKKSRKAQRQNRKRR
jgi:hypothetical protein